MGGLGVTGCSVDEPHTERVVNAVLLTQRELWEVLWKKRITVTPEMSDSAGFWHTRR